MDTRDKHEGSTLTIMEAVETLSSIADMNIDTVLNYVNHPELVDESQQGLDRIVQWLHPGDMGATVESVRETFRVILHYLRNFYRKESGYVTREETTEGIKTIMLLVGEAAKKLDKYTQLFLHRKTKSVTELKEYIRLQEFYLSRIAHKVDESTLGKWLIELTKRMMTSTIPLQFEAKQRSLTQHVFVDLEAVKKDSEYELFFIRKEDGTRFFSPRLIRNIKLVCDFGEYLTKVKMDDPLESLKLWEDHKLHLASKQILASVAPLVKAFYSGSLRLHPGELCEALSKSLMSLMLANTTQNLMHDPALKSCINYFRDFQYFLRQALHTREYQKLIAYPPKKTDGDARFLIQLSQTLCHSYFTQIQEDPELISHINNLVQESVQEASSEHQEVADFSKLLWSRLGCDYTALSKLIKRHASGPLLKVLDLLEDGSYNAFDPISQNNVPTQLYAIYNELKKVVSMYMPSPTYQEFINKVSVTEEFKGFLRSMAERHEGEHHLLFNLQDRTSWKEHARCMAVEDLQKVSDFENFLTVVTLSKDTEFYQQLAPYNQDNQASIFMEHFIENISDENCGYFFPQEMKHSLFPDFVKGVIHGIHRVFFGSKNVLTREARLDFIEIFYLFLQLKVIELVNPTTMSFTCKDGVDVGAACNVQLCAFLKLLDEEPFTQRDFQLLNYILYAPSLTSRERLIQTERFNRLQNVIKTIELIKQEFGPNFAKIVNEAFGRFYRTPILNASIEREGLQKAA